MHRKVTMATAAGVLLGGAVWVGAHAQPQIGTPDARPPAPTQSEPKGSPKAVEPKAKAGEPKAEPKVQPKALEPKAEPKAQPKAAEPKAEPKGQPKAAEPKAAPQAPPKAAEPKADPKTTEPPAGTQPPVTSEQRTRIRETIFNTSNPPRVTSVNFSLNVGTVVPRTVTVVVLPTTVVEIYPAWRG